LIVTIIVDSRDIRALERGHNRYERCQRGGYRNALFNSIKDRALDGQVIRFNIPFEYKDSLVMFEPDAFGDVEDHCVSFCIDHELETAVASTDHGLQLIVDDDAIQFRLDLERAANGYVVARLCEIGNREAMSVCCDILEERTKTIAGYDVRVVNRARLREISLCNNGAAGDNAFAFLVDTTITPKPVAGSRSKKFQDYNALYKVSRKVRAIKATNIAVLSLQERLALLSSELTPIDWSMTVHHSNHLQSLEFEQLQNERRAVLGM
jgi:HK97 family phage prohead protease